jgi:hypothetical protein
MPLKVFCDNQKCKWCYKYYTGAYICNAQSLYLNDVPKDYVYTALECMTYEAREGVLVAPELQPGRDPTGRYPGQLKYKGE